VIPEKLFELPEQQGPGDPMYKVIPTNITYDDERYRASVQTLRRARAAIDELPEAVRDRVLGIAKDVFQSTVSAAEALHNPLVDTTKAAIVVNSESDYLRDLVRFNGLEALFKK